MKMKSKDGLNGVTSHRQEEGIKESNEGRPSFIGRTKPRTK